ncbi:YraN family protein [Alicyclobacillus dauci]|uniref:UPF0102 protein NZD86_14145 n=1 Tax=Alicyclobacillus dauci TaxID=1475485 RepID=A0ABY6YXV2_9BACL|nr:YraN family protein [Alicyclobacillus dauci]WAH35438.1 YraN family protein [Alicyclobacillus dauci]
MSINMEIVAPASLGILGEETACVYLTRCLGWNVIERNVRTRYGEIDIVACTPREVVFVEVKSRRGTRFGSALEAVTSLKVARLTEQARLYVHRCPFDVDDRAICLDVIGLTYGQGCLLQSIDHVRLFPE